MIVTSPQSSPKRRGSESENFARFKIAQPFMVRGINERIKKNCIVNIYIDKLVFM